MLRLESAQPNGHGDRAGFVDKSIGGAKSRSAIGSNERRIHLAPDPDLNMSSDSFRKSAGGESHGPNAGRRLSPLKLPEFGNIQFISTTDAHSLFTDEKEIKLTAAGAAGSAGSQRISSFLVSYTPVLWASLEPGLKTIISSAIREFMTRDCFWGIVLLS